MCFPSDGVIFLFVVFVFFPVGGMGLQILIYIF